MKVEDFAKDAQDARGKTWFCTWPKCAIPKEVALKELEKLGLKEYIVAEEKHKDGDPHLHAFLVLRKRKSWNKDLFNISDLGVTYHGNYQHVYCVEKCRNYCIKDGNYVTNISEEVLKGKHVSKLRSEDYLRDPVELLEEGRITFFQIANFLKNQNLYKMLLSRKTKVPEIAVKKKRHHWIYGVSNTGKTTYLREKIANEEGGWFQIPLNNDWIGYNGEKNLYLDEYKGQLTVQELNRICDGGSKVNTKGGSAVLAYNVVVWICSNYDISECYKKVDNWLLDTLFNRFQVHVMTTVYEEDA